VNVATIASAPLSGMPLNTTTASGCSSSRMHEIARASRVGFPFELTPSATQVKKR
jgi:hypothetical protein